MWLVRWIIWKGGQRNHREPFFLDLFSKEWFMLTSVDIFSTLLLEGGLESF